jgi:hypothetical protein
MFGQVYRRFSYANVVATLALFIALGGSSYAAIKLAKNSVRSSHIKNAQVKRADLARNAVNSTKVADGSLLGEDFRAGQLPAGPQGPAGPKGDTGVTTLKVRATTATGATTANCQPGERATGGGAHSVDGFVDGSGPTSQPLAFEVKTGITFQDYTPTAWSAAARDVNGDPTDVTAWVVCAAP